MDKELKIVLKRINIEKYKKEQTTNCDSDDCEVLVMNYNDVIFEDNAEIADVIPKKEEQICDPNVEYNEFQETVGVSREVKFEDEELCDIDTKQNILVKFEKNTNDTEKEKNRNNKKSNSEKRKLVCHQCGFKAEKKHHLQSHIQQAHQNKKEVPTEFECEYCMFKTKWKHSIGPHMASFHMEELQTDGSSKSSPKKSSYDVQGVNIMDHCTLDENKTYHCNYCSHTALQKILMLRHTAVHTVNKREVLQCPQCPKKFTKPVLQVHMNKVHNPEGIFHCPKCSYSAKWKTNLRRHLKQNKDNETCRRVQVRKSQTQLKQERLEGKAPPARKKKKRTNSDY